MNSVAELSKTLHPLEIKVILSYDENDFISSSSLLKDFLYNEGQATKTIAWLNAKNILIEKFRKVNLFYSLTDKGREALINGLIEEKIIKLVNENEVFVYELSTKLGGNLKEIGKAFGNLSQEGVLDLDKNKKVIFKGLNENSRFKIIKSLLEKAKDNDILEDDLNKNELKAILTVSKKKGSGEVFFKIIERLDLKFSLSKIGLLVKDFLIKNNLTGDEVTKLTSEMIKNQTYKNKKFRAYNIHISPSRIPIGRENPYVSYILKVKDKLVSLGFEEFDGPLVETEFFNNDVLFIPQFHPARDVRDVYYLKDPSFVKELKEPYFSNVKATHENGFITGSRGWKYDFKKSISKRLILRTHGTVLSAKQLIKLEPSSRNVGKYFGIVRCFRYDQVNATHGADFYQTDGIVIGDDVNIKTLFGFLEIFAKELAGAIDINYVPAYFPFTEPSVEVHIKHPALGWFELGGSGILRPEVTKSLGIDVPVIAWGIGIDRMALSYLGLDDLRELFTYDIGKVVFRR